MPLLVLFIAVPLIEIALFIQVGGAIGLWSTLLIVILTAIFGTWLVRSQGALAMSQIKNSFQSMNDPSEPLAHGAMILFSGALLLTPGFFTDAIGFALLIPQVRHFVFHKIKQRINIMPMSTHHRQSANPQGPVVDAEVIDITPSDKPSGWTKD